MYYVISNVKGLNNDTLVKLGGSFCSFCQINYGFLRIFNRICRILVFILVEKGLV